MINFREITEDNFAEIIGMNMEPGQERFVAPNVKSLAQCWLYRNEQDVMPRAIYNDDTPVGFVLLDLLEEEKEFIIWRIMFDRHHQRQGYGGETIKLLLDEARQLGKFNYVVADHVPGNEAMKKLLAHLGFRETRFREDIHEYECRYWIGAGAEPTAVE